MKNKESQKIEDNVLTTTQSTKKPITHKLDNLFFVLGIILFFVSFLPYVGMIASLAYALILVLILILSVFTLLANKKFMNQFQNSSNINNFFASFAQFVPYALYLTAMLFLISLLLTAFSKNKTKKRGVIIFKSILIIITLLIGLFINFNIWSYLKI